MRFLKNIFLAASILVVSFAFTSCENESSAPEERSLLTSEDLIGKDIGISIENPSYTLEIVHSDFYSDAPSDTYLRGFRLILPVSDTSKRDIIVKMAITLIDASSKSIRRELNLEELKFYFIKGWGYYSLGLFSPHFDRSNEQFVSPEYICKVRLFNANNDSSKTIAFLIKTESYPTPETFMNEWINSADLKISFSETNSLYKNRAISFSYYGGDKGFLGFSYWQYLQTGENSVHLSDVPGDAVYYIAKIEDNFSGYNRSYMSEFQPIPPRVYTNVETANILGSVNKIEYLQKLNKLLLISAKSKEIAMINADTYALEWKKSLTETPYACKYDEKTNKIYIGCGMGGLYSFDPASGAQEFLTKFNPGINLLDVADNYIIAVNSSGYYMVYNTLDGTTKNSEFYHREFSQYPLLTNDFKYNPLSGKLYLVSDKSVYSFNFDLNTGIASFSARDLMSERGDIRGGSALYLTPENSRLITGWGLIYLCSSDSTTDLKYDYSISFLDHALWLDDKSYMITASQRYWSEPSSLCIYDYYFYSLYAKRYDLAGIPLKVATAGNKIRVFETLNDGSLVIQTFKLN